MNKKKMLIVDDDNTYLKVLEKIFSKMEYEAEFAGSSEDALKILETEKFPLIITDLEMPGLNGVELCKQIRKIDPKAIVYALSGYIAEFDTENLENVGFDGYLAKPAKIEVLKKAIEGAFDKLEENK